MAQGPTVTNATEVETTLGRLTANPAVRGVLVLDRPRGFIIRSAGPIFETGDGETARRYAARIHRLLGTSSEEIDGLIEDGDDLRFMRLRTRRHELMISPDERYILVVVQDPPK